LSAKESIPPRDSWIVLDPRQSILMTPEIAAGWERQKIALRQIRGNIIAYSLDIEFAMDVVIREMLFSCDLNINAEFMEKAEKDRSIFDRVVSKSGVITFNNKIKILKNLLRENQIISKEDIKMLLKLLEEVKVIRNKFAHTTIAFEPKTSTEKTLLIAYIIEAGKRLYLDDNYFYKLDQIFSECLVRVENITRTIQKKPLEALPKKPKTEEAPT